MMLCKLPRYSTIPVRKVTNRRARHVGLLQDQGYFAFHYLVLDIPADLFAVHCTYCEHGQKL